jgi:hypothetical protein
MLSDFVSSPQALFHSFSRGVFLCPALACLIARWRFGCRCNGKCAVGMWRARFCPAALNFLLTVSAIQQRRPDRARPAQNWGGIAGVENQTI